MTRSPRIARAGGADPGPAPTAPSAVVVALAFGAGLASSAFASGPKPEREPPLGHRDFYPSPERPVGFRGDGNGWFPGATPVTEWWEGTPVERDTKYTDKWGKEKSKKAWYFADDRPRNIVWKTEMPGWANTQPVVVGDRAFTHCEPDVLVCVDAGTGEIIWRKAVNPWACAGVEPRLAERLREMYHVYLAVDAFLTLQFHFNTCGRYFEPEDYKRMADIFRQDSLPRILKALAGLDPGGQYQGAAEKTMAFLDGYFESPSKAEKLRNSRELRALEREIERRIRDLGKVRIPMEVPWGNMVGWCMSVPVSDGEFVFVNMGQGQTACFDLNGRLVWRRWFEQKKVSTHHILSPVLVGDVLLDLHGNGTLRGLDKKTGRTVWEAATSASVKSRKDGYYVASHKVMRLGDVDVIVTSQCSIIRARDGKAVGELPFGEAYGGGAPVAGWGDVVLKCANGDGWAEPFRAFRLKLEGEDKVTAQKLWEAAKGDYPSRIVTPRATFLCAKKATAIETATGRVLFYERDLGGEFRVLAGRLLLWAAGGNNDKLGSHWQIRRQDGNTVLAFHVTDFSNPSSPRRVSDRNLLGGKNVPRLPGVEKYIPRLWEHPDFYNGHGGKPGQFVHTDTCMFPQGNRLFIRSTSHLYCIGDPKASYDWNPDSRPERIAAKLEGGSGASKGSRRGGTKSASKPKPHQASAAAGAKRKEPSPAAKAKYDAALLRLVRAKVESGAGPRFRLSAMRTTVTVTGASADGKLSVSARGMTMGFQLSALKAADKAGLALAVADRSRPDDCAATAFFLTAAGRGTEAADWLALAGDAAEAVRAAFK